MSTPLTSSFWQPAEWERHQSCWLAYPSDRELWGDLLEVVQEEFFSLARAIGGSEKLEILTPDSSHIPHIQSQLDQLEVRYHAINFGDIWMRDMAPIFLKNDEGRLATVRFCWNGWGGKYLLEGDSEVADRICKFLALPTFSFPWVLEGGAVEVDGEGTCITTRQCLCNPNRNPDMDEKAIEEGLRSALGVKKILWLDRGLKNDHTDGHVDTVARFVAPGKVVCMAPSRCDDPNQEVLAEIAATLETYTDAQGRKLEVIPIPSPGLVLGENKEVLPASYLNFYIANDTVIVPTYATPWDEDAVEAIAACFPTRATIGLSAKAILEGGGAFHCITQQQPLEL